MYQHTLTNEFIPDNCPRWRDLTVNQTVVGSNPTSGANLDGSPQEGGDASPR